MKYNQFHKLIITNGWTEVRQEGSHKIYKKDGFPPKSVPYHQGKEIHEGLRLRLVKEMGLK